MCLGFCVCAAETLGALCVSEHKERSLVALSGPGTLSSETLGVPWQSKAVMTDTVPQLEFIKRVPCIISMPGHCAVKLCP